MEGTYYLATVHRAENTDDLRRLTAIVEAFEQQARAARVILPPHPRTKAALEHSGR
ncbi:MAG: hypothetical protein KGR25_12455 [Chloroflexi bacterium]|nr:hypothetical protein [Chloroflexota bacterium]